MGPVGPVGVGTVGGVGTSFRDAWESALTSLEVDVAAAERMLALDRIAETAPASRWTPPTGLGPLPLSLADRATALLERQIEVGRRLAEAAELSRRHLKAAHAMRATAPSAPVYLDLPA